MKTAMQELIELINKRDYISNFVIRDKAIKLLEKEKEQIIQAYLKGYIHYHPELDSKEYYNQTYNK